MSLYEHPTRDPKTHHIRVIIDTPAGSRNKYKLDEATGLFRISRMLPQGMIFPHDFGSIPRTSAADGDPLDALVMGLGPTFVGCLVHVRLIGVLRGHQLERGRRVQNDRLLAAAVSPVNAPLFDDIKDLPPEQLREIEEFFVSYNRVQGRKFAVTGRAGPRAAESALRRAEREFARTHREASS